MAPPSDGHRTKNGTLHGVQCLDFLPRENGKIEAVHHTRKRALLDALRLGSVQY
jgi:hypothetical protein